MGEPSHYLALHLAVMVPLFGGALLARVVWQPRTVLDFVGWCFTALVGTAGSCSL